MRTIALTCAALSLAACSESEELSIGTYQGVGGGRMCIAQNGAAQRAGLSIPSDGLGNCTVQGSLTKNKSGWEITPHGEEERTCVLTLDPNDKGLVMRAQGNCSYYCGPGASLDFREFRGPLPANEDAKVTDIAGDPLC